MYAYVAVNFLWKSYVSIFVCKINSNVVLLKITRQQNLYWRIDYVPIVEIKYLFRHFSINDEYWCCVENKEDISANNSYVYKFMKKYILFS